MMSEPVMKVARVESVQYTVSADEVAEIDSVTMARCLHPDDTFVSGLFFAVCVGNGAVVERILSRCSPAMVEAGTNVSKRSPLYAAVVLGHTRIVQMLIEHGADRCVVANGNSLFYEACRWGHLDLVKILAEIPEGASDSLKKSLRDTTIGFTKKNGMTPLHVAAERNHVDICAYLVKVLSIDIHVRSDSGSTPLHLACLTRSEGVIDCLLEMGACVDTVDDQGWTPISVTAQSGSPSILRKLVNAPLRQDSSLYVQMKRTVIELTGIPIDNMGEHDEEEEDELVGDQEDAIPSPYLETLLEFDWEQDLDGVDIPSEIIRILRVNRRKTDQYPPLFVAARAPRRAAIIDELVELGANPRAILSEGVTALMVAAKNGRLGNCKTLVTHLSDVEIRVGTFQHRWNALHWATKGGHVEIVRFLLELPGIFDVNTSASNGMTPLYIACHYNQMDVMRCLIESFNASVNGVEGSQLFPLYAACKHGHLQVVKYLLLNTPCDRETSPSPIHIAAKYNHSDIVRFLHETIGVPVDQPNRQGWTPIHCAARAGALDAVKYFVDKHGAEFVTTITTSTPHGATNSMNFTPVHLAAANDQYAMMRYFGFIGADFNTTCLGGGTAEIMAEHSGHQWLAEWIRRATHWSKIHFLTDSRDKTQVLQLLTSDHKDDIKETQHLTVPTETGDTPLMISVIEPVVWMASNQHGTRRENPLFSITTLKTFNRDVLESIRDKYICTKPDTPYLIGYEKPISALKSDQELVEIILKAMVPWTPQTHSVYPPSFNMRIIQMLLVNQRKHDQGLPSIQDECMLKIFQFLPRI